jgi:hypothetical protein
MASVPIVMIPLTLALIHYHPETPDDCPCFEDAIAIMAVILGSFVGHWDKARNHRDYGPSLWRNGAVWGAAIGLLRVVIGECDIPPRANNAQVSRLSSSGVWQRRRPC